MKIKKILFLKDEHIGDYALSLPILKSLRIQFPKSQIDIVVGPWNKELAEATPYINKIIIFENPFIKRKIGYFELIKEAFFNRKKFKNFFNRINKEKYDLIISLSSRRYTKILLKFMHAENKISGTTFKITEEKEINRFFRILKKIGLTNLDKKIHLRYLKKDKEKIYKILGKKGMKKNKIVIHPITPLKEKNWKKQNWIKLINEQLSKNKRTYIFLVGSTSQKKELEEIKKKIYSTQRVLNLAGKLNLLQLILLIEKSELFIGGDSGPMHLAELTSTPIIALFGGFTNEKIWGPYRKGDKTIKRTKINEIKPRDVLKLIK